MPEKVEACVRSVMDDNPDMSEDRAYAICKSQEQEGNLEDEAALADNCPSGQVEIGGECVDVEEVDAPPSILQSEPRIMASASPLDTQPIEREELDGGKVAYRGLKLIDSGIWTDSASETPTLYDERTFENTEAEIPNGHDGPPVNIAHDIHKDGPNAGEPHEASIGGYIDPDSIQTDGEALFGDVILDRGTDAGAFADTNLKSALENDGRAGFSPSVELMATELEDADHREAEEYVKAASLTGLGLVRDPASKSVDLARETQTRSVALSANSGGSSPKAKVLTRQDRGMRELMDADELRETLDNFGFEDLDEMTDDEVMSMAESLMDDLSESMQDEGGEGEGDGQEMADGEDDEEMLEGDGGEEVDEEEDDGKDMADDEMASMQETIAELTERLSDVEDALSDKMGEEDVEQELADAADADTVAELKAAKDELDKRLKALEDEPAESKTLADASAGGEDGFTPSYDDGPASPSNW